MKEVVPKKGEFGVNTIFESQVITGYGRLAQLTGQGFTAKFITPNTLLLVRFWPLH